MQQENKKITVCPPGFAIGYYGQARPSDFDKSDDTRDYDFLEEAYSTLAEVEFNEDKLHTLGNRLDGLDDVYYINDNEEIEG